jgi:hypothetical protein
LTRKNQSETQTTDSKPLTTTNRKPRPRQAPQITNRKARNAQQQTAHQKPEIPLNTLKEILTDLAEHKLLEYNEKTGEIKALQFILIPLILEESSYPWNFVKVSVV